MQCILRGHAWPVVLQGQGASRFLGHAVLAADWGACAERGRQRFSVPFCSPSAHSHCPTPCILCRQPRPPPPFSAVAAGWQLPPTTVRVPSSAFGQEVIILRPPGLSMHMMRMGCLGALRRGWCRPCGGPAAQRAGAESSGAVTRCSAAFAPVCYSLAYKHVWDMQLPLLPACVDGACEQQPCVYSRAPGLWGRSWQERPLCGLFCLEGFCMQANPTNSSADWWDELCEPVRIGSLPSCRGAVRHGCAGRAGRKGFLRHSPRCARRGRRQTPCRLPFGVDA